MSCRFRTFLLITSFFISLAHLTAQNSQPSPKANLIQSLLDTLKIQDPEERLRTYDSLAKLLSPERIIPNPWTISMSKDEANDLTTYVILDKKVFDQNNNNGFNLSIIYFRKGNGDGSYLKLYFSNGGAENDVRQLTVQKNTDELKYRYENGDTSEEGWHHGDFGGWGYFAVAPFPGKVLHEFAAHDTIYLTYVKTGETYKYDIRGLGPALAKYNLSLDELIKVAELSSDR